MVSDELGERLVKLARAVIESDLGLPTKVDKNIEAGEVRRGVFVTLYSSEARELRGCMGIPTPRMSVVDGTIYAARLAAFHDPRFPPLTRSEVDEVLIELTLLTEPELISAQPRTSLPSLIKIGADGLIIEADEGAGLLLPQVPVEYGWSAEEFLMHLCIKAGLRPADWLRSDVRIYRFNAEIFEEETPRGKVKRLRLPAQ